MASSSFMFKDYNFTFPSTFKCCLTGRPCTRQTKAKMTKSQILAKLGWVDQLIGGVDHTKYFCPEVTLIGVRAHPIFEVTKKN